jgi:hypothetical protein
MISRVPVSATYVSSMETEAEVLAEAIQLKNNSRLDWIFKNIRIGSIAEKCQYWATQDINKIWIISFSAKIPISHSGVYSAASVSDLKITLQHLQTSGLIRWFYREVLVTPISGVYTDSISDKNIWIVEILPITTNTTINLSDIYAYPTQQVTVIASVSSDHGIPTGLVIFKSDGTVFNTAVVDYSGNAVTFTTFPVGDHEITAEYQGENGYLPSASLPEIIHITPLPGQILKFLLRTFI